MRKYFISIFVFFLFTNINSGYSQIAVQYYGKLMSVMQGDITSKFDMKRLQNEKNIFALGAVENLKGEITIINSRPFIVSVQENELEIDTTYNTQATLLVFSRVKQWKNFDIKQDLNSIVDIVKYIDHKVVEDFVNIEPFPFLLKAKVKSLSWHVINWAENDTVHTHKKHKDSGLHAVIHDRDVIIIGFYSMNHQGIISHRNSNLHMHFVTKDNQLSGHIDEVALTEDSIFSIAD